MSPRWVPTAVLLLGLGCAEGASVVGGPARDAAVTADGGLDGSTPRDVAPEAPPPECRGDAECDDRVACTVDRCLAGRCEHAPSAALCPAGSACEALRGCRTPRACDDAAGCRDDDPCTVAERCDVGRRVCVFDELPAQTPCGAPGSGRACRGGACQCPADRATLCADGCVDTRSDPAHCGACASACAAGAWCRDGACACPAGQAYCPGVGCVDPAIDPANCGACGRACRADDAGLERCIEGQCLGPCAAGTHRCGTTCASDTATATCGASCVPCPSSAHGVARCAAGRCSLDCAAGYHECGGACLELTSLQGCGAACAVCVRPARGSVACVGDACRVTCEAGYHACRGDCVSDASTLSCGSSCEPCFTPPHGAATCAAGVCGVTCAAGFRACNGTCSDGTSPLACGAACARCPAPLYGVATCTAGACGFTCNPGLHRCGEACLPDASPLSCGAACAPCPVPAHATATCAAGVCGFTCDLGFRRTATACVELPRPLAPGSLTTVTVRRPTLRWRLPAELSGVSVDLCRDRACGSILETLTATGSSASPTRDLPAGVVFWRVRGGVDTSATWEFVVGAAGAAAESTWGSLPDVNGDGYGDVVVASPDNRVSLFLGAAGGLQETPAIMLRPPAGSGAFGQAVAVGDLDGDGFADVVVTAPDTEAGRGQAYVYPGGAGGLNPLPASVLTSPAPAGGRFGAALAVVGDVDGDGYGDVVVGAPRAAVAGRAYLYRGGPGGPEAEAGVTLAGPSSADGRFGAAVAGAGDVDGDGLAEVLVGADGAASDAGRAYLYRGARAALGGAPWRELQSPGGGGLGAAVAGAGDVDGDGYPDVAVGAPDGDGIGEVLVFGGGATGLGALPVRTLRPPGDQASGFGTVVSSAGDFDGDGYADLMVGAPRLMPSGAVHLFLGGASGLPAAAAATWRGLEAGGAGFGRAMAGGRDVDGDGRSEVILGAEYADGFTGVALIVRGGSLTAALRVLPTPPAAGGYFGHAVASLPVDRSRPWL